MGGWWGNTGGSGLAPHSPMVVSLPGWEILGFHYPHSKLS